MKVDTEQLLEWINKINLILLFKSIHEDYEHYQKPILISIPIIEFDKIVSFVNSKVELCPPVHELNAMQVVTNALVKVWYQDIDYELLFKEDNSFVVIYDLHNLQEEFAGRADVANEQDCKVMLFDESWPVNQDVNFEIYKNKFCFTTTGVHDFVEKIKSETFSSSVGIFAALFASFVESLKAKSKTMNPNLFVVNMMHKRYKECEKIIHQIQGLSDLLPASYQKVKRMFDTHHEHQILCANILKNLDDLNEVFKLSVEAINKTLSVANGNNAIAVLNEVAQLVEKLLNVFIQIKQKLAEFKEAEDKHAYSSIDVENAAKQSLLDFLESTAIFKQPKFIGSVAKYDCNSEKLSVIEKTCALIYKCFSKEVMDEIQDVSISALQNYAQRLLVYRQNILDNLLLRARASINIDKLEKKIRSLLNCNDVEPISFDVDISSHAQLQQIVFELNYDDEVAKANICHILNLEKIFSDEELAKKSSALLEEFKNEINFKIAELELLDNSYEEINGKQFALQAKSDKCLTWIAIFKTLPDNFFGNQWFVFKDFVAEMEQNLRQLHEQVDCKVHDCQQHRINLTPFEKLLHGKIFAIKQLINNWSLKEFSQQCEDFLKECIIYRKSMQNFMPAANLIQDLDNSFAAISSCHEKIFASNLRFCEPEIIDLFKVVKQSSTFSGWQDEVLQMYDAEHTIAKIANQLAIKALSVHLLEITRQKDLFAKLNFDLLSTQDVKEVNNFLSFNADVEIKNATDLLMIHDYLQSGHNLYVKYTNVSKKWLLGFFETTKILNHPLFIEYVNKYDSDKEKLSIIQSTFGFICQRFAKEIKHESQEYSIKDMQYYVRRLLACRQKILDDLLDDARATIGFNKLQENLSAQLVCNDINLISFDIDPNSYNELQKIVFELNYDEKIVKAKICNILNLSNILSIKELVTLAKNLTQEFKHELDSKTAELKLLEESSVIITEQLLENKVKSDKCLAWIDVYKSLPDNFFSQETPDFKQFVEEMKQNLQQLYKQVDSQIDVYRQQAIKLLQVEKLLHNEALVVGQLANNWSVNDFLQQCKIVIQEFIKYKNVIQDVTPVIENIQEIRNNLAAISLLHQKISTSILSCCNEDLINILKVLKQSEILSLWQDEAVRIYDENHVTDEIVSCLAIKIIDRHAKELADYKNLLNKLNRNFLPIQEAQNIAIFLSFDISNIKEPKDLLMLHNYLEFGRELYAKHSHCLEGYKAQIIASNNKKVVLEPFTCYANKNEACGLFFHRPIMNYATRLAWYQELEPKVAKINAYLMMGDVSSVQLQSFMLDLSRNVEGKIQMANDSSTFSTMILLPLKNSLKNVLATYFPKEKLEPSLAHVQQANFTI